MSRTYISVLALLLLFLTMGILTPLARAESPQPIPAANTVSHQDEPVEEETPTNNPSDSFFDGVGAIFATLGVYVVTMFTMAIGTEIVVDIFKGVLGKPLGLKSQPNSRKTLAEYQAFLPGKLEELGFSAEAKLKIEKQIDQLNKLLEPAFTAEAVVNHLREKEFTAALTAAGLENIGDDQIDQVKEVTQVELDKVVAQIDTSTTLGKAVQVALKRGDLVEKAHRAIDRLARQATAVTAEQLYKATATLVTGEIADGVTAWTRAYFTSLQEESYEAALSMYENQLKPQIEAFGLPEKLKTQLTEQFEEYLENLKTYRGTDVYLESLNRFLAELELQRDQVRSGIGQLWFTFVNWFKRLLIRVPRIQDPKLTPRAYDPHIRDTTEAAAKLVDLDRYDKELESKRIRRTRLVSVIIGIFLAYMLQIDSADLLQDLFPAEANFLDLTLINAELFGRLGLGIRELSAGIILTGLAASAGSGFWHDQLSRLQSIKKGVEQAQATLQPIIIQTQNANEQ
ncbi:MAG: hypothetical protein DHS20C20_04410 [Ardenticatenaceae bacterium]|nr:MAG: hypothetical protein DHS20C20_04410 [Ardenticatenaceae bacterium]